MLKRFSLLAAVIFAGLIPMVVSAASTSRGDQEYEQVRKIAMRDPKVKAAFENANQRLEAKIIEIDPALRERIKGRSGQTSADISPVTESAADRKPFVKSSKPAAPPARASTHLISTGDTFSSIAARNKVTVTELKNANPTVNDTKLQIGQTLTIPPHHRHPSQTAAAQPNAWERLKSTF